MRIAIISDIHSNYEALEEALKIIRTRSVDTIVCLGDIVGYGASPNECLACIRSSASYVLLGNHDEAALRLDMADYFNPLARRAAEWTSRQLTREHRTYVASLPSSLKLEGLYFVHSSPFEPQGWHYILSPADAQFNFAYFNEPICFIGHSHVPVVYSEDLWQREVVKGRRYIINVGSVGQPRDNDPRLSFGIFDTAAWSYDTIRADYNVELACEKIRAAGLPHQLADRLRVGR